jgi:hypothetical protein
MSESSDLRTFGKWSEKDREWEADETNAANA